MGHRNREIETKLLIPGLMFQQVCNMLDTMLTKESPIIRIGTSVDTYWPLPDAKVEGDFLRVRERDGIRQITVKGKDRGVNTNRIEIDIDSTSETHRIHRLFRCALGKPAGVIAKTYRVWELESEYDTVCAYELTNHPSGVIVEVEARTEERMLELEKQVRELFWSAQTAPGSLFEMYIVGGK